MQCDPSPHRQLNGFCVQNGQRARQPQTDRADLRVGSCPKMCVTAAKQFRFRLKLNVHLETNYGFVRSLRIHRMKWTLRQKARNQATFRNPTRERGTLLPVPRSLFGWRIVKTTILSKRPKIWHVALVGLRSLNFAQMFPASNQRA